MSRETKKPSRDTVKASGQSLEPSPQRGATVNGVAQSDSRLTFTHSRHTFCDSVNAASELPDALRFRDEGGHALEARYGNVAQEESAMHDVSRSFLHGN